MFGNRLTIENNLEGQTNDCVYFRGGAVALKNSKRRYTTLSFASHVCTEECEKESQSKSLNMEEIVSIMAFLGSLRRGHSCVGFLATVNVFRRHGHGMSVS